MATVTVRLYEELNDYLPRQQRKQALVLDFIPPCPVRHLIEQLGVPHTEIEVILRNGISVDLEASVADGDRLAVYPMFESLDISPLLRIRSRVLRRPGFFCDAHLGKLARHLRLLGFDSRYQNAIGDRELVAQARKEGRIILSRDRQLLMRREVTHGCHVRAMQPSAQLVEVIRRFGLSALARPFTRCMECNSPLQRVQKSDIIDELQNDTQRRYDEFWRCPGCARIYWKGTHYRHLSALVSRLIAGTHQRPG